MTDRPLTTTELAATFDAIDSVALAREEQTLRAGDGPAACAKCRTPFNEADTRLDGRAQYEGSLFCRRCVGRCHDTEIADHRCVICT